MTRRVAMSRHFNPRSSCEERLPLQSSLPCTSYFNPRSSCEERHGLLKAKLLDAYFNPRSSCEERLLQADTHQ